MIASIIQLIACGPRLFWTPWEYHLCEWRSGLEEGSPTAATGEEEEGLMMSLDQPEECRKKDLWETLRVGRVEDMRKDGVLL